MLDGVDISGWNVPIDASLIQGDLVIIKATEGLQGTVYNPTYGTMADQTLASGKLLGFYHYANGHDPVAEADSFWDAISDYRGRCVPCLDWEGQGNHMFLSGEDVDWCLGFLDRLAEISGTTPMIYMSKSVCNTYDWSPCARYPLWGAAYASDDDVFGYDHSPWDSSSPWGAWGDKPTLYQYTSSLVLDYNGGLGRYDGNLFYGDRSDWERMCGGLVPQQESQQEVRVMLSRADVAAEVMEHYCEHDEHGYSQYHRIGNDTTESLTLSDGTIVTITGGDTDCSELVRRCWEAAGVLDDYYSSYLYTAIEDEVLTSAGFVTVPLSQRRRGDVLWRSGHTGMYLGDELVGEAHHGDLSGGLDGYEGDQDGTEVRITSYESSLPWTTCYRYAGPEREGYEEIITEEDWSSTMSPMIILNIADDHRINPGDERTAMLHKGWQVLWTQNGGFKYMEHPDSIKLLNENVRYWTGKEIPQKESSSKAPVAFRLYQATALNAQNTVLRDRWIQQ